MGTPFNGRMAGLHPADESSILSVSTKFACVAEALDCGSNYESSILSGHPVVKKGVRLVESRQSLKLASGVRFAHPLPLAAGAIGSASDSDSGGSRFETWAASQSFTRVSFNGQDRTLRTFRLRFDSSRPYQGFRPVVQST